MTMENALNAVTTPTDTLAYNLLCRLLVVRYESFKRIDRLVSFAPLSFGRDLKISAHGTRFHAAHRRSEEIKSNCRERSQTKQQHGRLSTLVCLAIKSGNRPRKGKRNKSEPFSWPLLRSRQRDVIIKFT